MICLERFFRRDSDSIKSFHDDAELTLNFFSKSLDFTYSELFSSNFNLPMMEYSNNIPPLDSRHVSLKNSKLEALKDLVESSAAPYLCYENLS